MNQQLSQLTATIEARKTSDPSSSYVAKLFAKGSDAILKKIGEEASEFIIASKNGQPGPIVAEASDLLFHLMVGLAHHGLSLKDVSTELARREGLSGITEKAQRKD